MEPKRGWTTEDRLRRSISMQGNRNAVRSSFSDDLVSQYGKDPELVDWIEGNRKSLDIPCLDGSLPKSEKEIVKTDDLPLFTLNANVGSR